MPYVIADIGVVVVRHDQVISVVAAEQKDTYQGTVIRRDRVACGLFDAPLGERRHSVKITGLRRQCRHTEGRGRSAQKISP
jgi:hypothetical protein